MLCICFMLCAATSCVPSPHSSRYTINSAHKHTDRAGRLRRGLSLGLPASMAMYSPAARASRQTMKTTSTRFILAVGYVQLLYGSAVASDGVLAAKLCNPTLRIRKRTAALACQVSMQLYTLLQFGLKAGACRSEFCRPEAAIAGVRLTRAPCDPGCLIYIYIHIYARTNLTAC